MGSVVVAIVLFVIGGVFALSGVWEIVAGRNLPGVLGYGYLPRHRPKKSATWRPWRWRVNGMILLVLAAALVYLGLTVY
jgi:hypothetical protein